MKGLARTIALCGGAGALLLGLCAAQRPAVLAQASGGLWEISGAPGTAGPVRQCLPDPSILAQFEHRGTSCARAVIRNEPSLAEVHYTCARGGFGRSTLTLITPRSLRIETQGISGKAPFNYVLQARRVGNCGGH